MKKLFIIATILFFSVFTSLLILPTTSLATEGTCSWHGGVNCSAGPDWDTSAICNDGWTESGERYFQQAVCQSNFACMADQWQQKSQSSKMVADRAHFSDLVTRINTLNLEYPMIEIKIQQDIQNGVWTTAALAGQVSAAQRTNRNEVTTLVYEATLLDQKLRSEQVGINNPCSLMSGGATSNFSSLTKESCTQDHGLNSVLSGSTCTCKDNYMFNSAKQCMPAGDVCTSEYGEGGIPSTYSECACAYGFHLENGRHCAVDPKPVKMIPTNVKKWVDNNYTKTSVQCSSNLEFSPEEFKICDEYNNPFTRQKYEWKVEKLPPVAPLVGILSLPTPTNNLDTPRLPVPTLPKPKITSEKPKIVAIEKSVEVSSTTTPQVFFSRTTTGQVSPVAEEVKIPPSPTFKPKPLWSRVVSWFKFW